MYSCLDVVRNYCALKISVKNLLRFMCQLSVTHLVKRTIRGCLGIHHTEKFLYCGTKSRRATELSEVLCRSRGVHHSIPESPTAARKDYGAFASSYSAYDKHSCREETTVEN